MAFQRIELLRNLVELAVLVVLVLLGFKLGRIFIVDKFSQRPDNEVLRWLTKHWPRHAGLVFVHRAPVPYALVLTIAQYLLKTKS